MNSQLPHNHNENNFELHLVEALPSIEDFNIVSELFKLLSDTSRLQIFWVLCHTEECVINLASMLDMTSPAISHHLKILKASNLIESRREGKEVYYKTVDTEQAQMLHIAIERTMEISCPEISDEEINSENNQLSEHIKTIHKVHSYLIENLEKRITIENLSRQFLINPTTLKDTFKEVFGCSIAAHIKNHRLEKAAQLLTTTSKSVSEISALVGYASQSKFSAAFYKQYNTSPLKYRKNK